MKGSGSIKSRQERRLAMAKLVFDIEQMGARIVLTKGATWLRLWVLQTQAGKPTPKTQRFAGDGLARHGHRVSGRAKPSKSGIQLSQKWLRTSRIAGAPMALSVEPRMPCISIRIGLLPARACLPSFVLRPPSNDH